MFCNTHFLNLLRMSYYYKLNLFSKIQEFLTTENVHFNDIRIASNTFSYHQSTS